MQNREKENANELLSFSHYLSKTFLKKNQCVDELYSVCAVNGIFILIWQPQQLQNVLYEDLLFWLKISFSCQDEGWQVSAAFVVYNWKYILRLSKLCCYIFTLSELLPPQVLLCTPHWLNFKLRLTQNFPSLCNATANLAIKVTRIWIMSSCKHNCCSSLQGSDPKFCLHIKLLSYVKTTRSYHSSYPHEKTLTAGFAAVACVICCVKESPFQQMCIVQGRSWVAKIVASL